LGVLKAFRLVGDSVQLHDDLGLKRQELDQRMADLENFLLRHNELQGLYKEFEQTLNQVNQNLGGLTRKLDETSDLQNLLRLVLLEMEKGVYNDYKLREGFIKKELEDLQEIEDQVFGMDEVRQAIAVNLQILRQDKNLQGESGMQVSQMSTDPDHLQQVISESMELLEKLEKAESQSQFCMKQLQQIRKDVGIADVPDLVQRREQELVEFSGKLRRLEVEFGEIKKILSSNSPNKEVQSELSNIETHLKSFKEEKNAITRILGQDLQVFLPQP